MKIQIIVLIELERTKVNFSPINKSSDWTRCEECGCFYHFKKNYIAINIFSRVVIYKNQRRYSAAVGIENRNSQTLTHKRQAHYWLQHYYHGLNVAELFGFLLNFNLKLPESINIRRSSPRYWNKFLPHILAPWKQTSIIILMTLNAALATELDSNQPMLCKNQDFHQVSIHFWTWFWQRDLSAAHKWRIGTAGWDDRQKWPLHPVPLRIR